MRRTEELTRAFYAFERPGRGWNTYGKPVLLEPEFIPIPTRHAPDLARPVLEDEEVGLRKNFSLSLSEEYRGDIDATLAWLETISTAAWPVSFELVGIGEETTALLSTAPSDELFLSTLNAPGLSIREGPGLPERLLELPSAFSQYHAFGLLREWMLPLGRRPILKAFAALLAHLTDGEGAVFQVLFKPVEAPFKEAGQYAIRTPHGLPFFRDRPDFEKETGGKLEEPLFATVLRIFSFAERQERLERIGAALLGLMGQQDGANSLVPLALDPESERDGFVNRTSYRTGMLLSFSELAALIHLPPGSDIGRKAPRLPEAFSRGRLILGRVKTRGGYRPVRIHKQARLMHTHVIGASGSGKSTLLLQNMLNDASFPGGFALLDPHGDLSDELLSRLPQERLSDVILFDPSDPKYVLGFNPLEGRTPQEREILASDLVAVFRRLATSWGDQMTTVLAYAILGILSAGGGTLHNLLRFLTEKETRLGYLSRSDDEFVRHFFEHEYPRLRGRPETSIVTRLHTLLRVPLLRDVLLEREVTVNIEGIIQEGKIFIARIPKGAIGSENAALLGSLLVTRIHMAAVQRSAIVEEKRTPFFVYIDEVHEVMSPSLSEIFSGARKFGLGVTVAHQSLSQIDVRHREALKALLSNAYTRVIFRVGEEDARFLSRTLPDVTDETLVNLSVGEAIARSGRGKDVVKVETLLPFGGGRSGAELTRVREEILARVAKERSEDHEPPLGARESKPRARVPEVEEKRARTRQEAHAPPPRQETTSPEPGGKKIPGHGGPEHRYLQGLVSEWGKSRGFRVALEESIWS